MEIQVVISYIGEMKPLALPVIKLQEINGKRQITIGVDGHQRAVIHVLNTNFPIEGIPELSITNNI